jgi:hypothetical protein
MTEQPPGPPPPPPPPPTGQYGYPQSGFQQPGYAPYYGYSAPELPEANTALILGLVALVGLFFTCGLTLFVSPFAWVTGHKARRTIAASSGQYGGDGKATAGMVLGIIGCALLVLAVIGVVVFVLLFAFDASTISDSGTTI